MCVRLFYQKSIYLSIYLSIRYLHPLNLLHHVHLHLLLQAYEKLSELAAAGKLKGKASEWDAKLKAVQASLGLCAVDDAAAEEGEGGKGGAPRGERGTEL
eukprot:scaffold16700_cov43-Phaeocystis_antarctica.AAC.1